MPKIARDCYEFWRTELRAIGIDRKPDAQALAAAAMSYRCAVEAELMVEREGQIIREPIFLQGRAHSGRVSQKTPSGDGDRQCALAAWSRFH